MKRFFLLAFLAVPFSGCVTTDTTMPDGTKIHTSRQDAKIVKVVVGAVSAAATEAVIKAMHDQAVQDGKIQQ